MANVTLTVPADKARRFRNESAFALECILDLLRDARDLSEGSEAVTALGAAERLVDQLQRQEIGTLHVDADSRVVHLTLKHCVIAAGGDVHGMCEGVGDDGEGIADVRRAIAELELWLELLESAEEGG